MPRLQDAFAEQIAADRQASAGVSRSVLMLTSLRCSGCTTACNAARYDFFYHLEALLTELARAAMARRPADLRALDAEREANPLWFQSNSMVGGVCYVDLFAGNLDGIRTKILLLMSLGSPTCT